MRSVCIGLLLLAGGLTEACMDQDPNELNGTPLVRRRTNHAKAIRADDEDLDEASSSDDDDDSTTTPSTTGTPSTSNTPAKTQIKRTVEQQCFEIINKYRAKNNL